MIYFAGLRARQLTKSTKITQFEFRLFVFMDLLCTPWDTVAQ